MPPDWNQSTNEPACASDLIHGESVITLLKLTYGEENDDNELEMPKGWCKTNILFLVKRWLSMDKLTPKYKHELGIDFDVAELIRSVTHMRTGTHEEVKVEDDEDDDDDETDNKQTTNFVDVSQELKQEDENGYDAISSGMSEATDSSEHKKKSQRKRKKTT